MKGTRLTLLLLVITTVTTLTSLCIGENGVGIGQLIGIESVDRETTAWIILENIRLPRTMAALAVGAMLGMSGCIMQGILRNPLVEPYTMGLSGGAILGVGIATSVGISSIMGHWGTTTFALAGGLATMLAVLAIRRRLGGNTNNMILAGVMISFATSSGTTLLMSLTTRENMTQIISWSIGSFDSIDQASTYAVCALAAACVIASPLLGNILNVMSTGESTASHLGLDVNKTIVYLFVTATVLAAISVSVAGIVAFVGMTVPHIIKRIGGSDHRHTLLQCGIAGGAFMLACDIAGRQAAYPHELPAGVFSGIAGATLFIWILTRREAR